MKTTYAKPATTVVDIEMESLCQTISTDDEAATGKTDNEAKGYTLPVAADLWEDEE